MINEIIWCLCALWWIIDFEVEIIDLTWFFGGFHKSFESKMGLNYIFLYFSVPCSSAQLIEVITDK